MFDVHAYRRWVAEAASAISESTAVRPRTGIILGTGLGGLVSDIELTSAISYADIPHFPVATVESHDGRLLIGHLEGTPVYVLQGRFHLYEGYDAREVTFPVRVLKSLGVETLLISNAAGGMNSDYRRGDLMLIRDHINFQGVNPLIGPNVAEWGPRFPDMSEPYDPGLREHARQAARDGNIRLHEGVYVAVTGPNLETPAEYRFLRRIGADAVGMSTIPEVIVARHMGMAVMAVSVITDECDPDDLAPVTIPEVLAAARAAEPSLQAVFHYVVQQLRETVSTPS